MDNPEIYKSLKHNLIVNLLDGGFFGFAMGFASFVTIIPLFVSTMTGSALLIGLIPAIHSMGWQLPQLLVAGRVARLPRYKPMMLLLTTQERLPFLGFAVVAWFLPRLGSQAALLLTFFLLVWQGLGAGFTASPWQSMIAKIIPSDRRGSFLGAQSSSANLLASLSALLAGVILEKLGSPLDFTLCFLLAFAMMAVSWYFLAQTSEPAHAPEEMGASGAENWHALKAILRRDPNFRWFLAARMLSQVAVVGVAFYTVYAVRFHGMSEVGVGVMTTVLLGVQIAANPLMGWLGDRWSHRLVMEAGILAAALSALTAWWAPSPVWFSLAFVLAGIANVAIWTVGMAFIMEFGSPAERPAYIGLANTLVAPATILAPLLGGWLADAAGYRAAFLVSFLGGLATVAVLHLRVQDPRRVLLGIQEERKPGEEAC